MSASRGKRPVLPPEQREKTLEYGRHIARLLGWHGPDEHPRRAGGRRARARVLDRQRKERKERERV